MPISTSAVVFNDENSSGLFFHGAVNDGTVIYDNDYHFKVIRSWLKEQKEDTIIIQTLQNL